LIISHLNLFIDQWQFVYLKNITFAKQKWKDLCLIATTVKNAKMTAKLHFFIHCNQTIYPFPCFLSLKI